MQQNQHKQSYLLHRKQERDGQDEQETELEEELARDGVQHFVVDRVGEIGVEHDVQLRVTGATR